MKSIRIGKINVDVKSALIGMAVFCVGLSLSPTQNFFTKIWTSVKSTINGVLGKK